jgi:hypothetical protein
MPRGAIWSEEHRMPLRGMCYDDCRFDPPKPPESGVSTTSGSSLTLIPVLGVSLDSKETSTLKK